MKNTNTIKRFLTVLLAAAAMSLAACDGGDSGGDSLPEGKVGTVGDGVNAAEFAAIQCGMNKDQVTAIVVDSPTSTFGDLGWDYKYVGGSHTQISFNVGGVVSGKNTGPTGKAPTTTVAC